MTQGQSQDDEMTSQRAHSPFLHLFVPFRPRGDQGPYTEEGDLYSAIHSHVLPFTRTSRDTRTDTPRNDVWPRIRASLGPARSACAFTATPTEGGRGSVWTAESLRPTDSPRGVSLSWLEGWTPLGRIRTLLKMLSQGAAALCVTWGPQSCAPRRTRSRGGTAGQGRKKTKGRGTASLRGLCVGMAPQSAPRPRAGPSGSLSVQLWVKSYGLGGRGGESRGDAFLFTCRTVRAQIPEPRDSESLGADNLHF